MGFVRYDKPLRVLTPRAVLALRIDPKGVVTLSPSFVKRYGIGRGEKFDAYFDAAAGLVGLQFTREGAYETGHSPDDMRVSVVKQMLVDAGYSLRKGEFPMTERAGVPRFVFDVSALRTRPGGIEPTPPANEVPPSEPPAETPAPQEAKNVAQADVTAPPDQPPANGHAPSVRDAAEERRRKVLSDTALEPIDAADKERALEAELLAIIAKAPPLEVIAHKPDALICCVVECVAGQDQAAIAKRLGYREVDQGEPAFKWAQFHADRLSELPLLKLREYKRLLMVTLNEAHKAAKGVGRGR